MKTARLITYEAPNFIVYNQVKSILGNYVFNRKSDDGRYFIQLDKTQEKRLGSIMSKLELIEE